MIKKIFCIAAAMLLGISTLSQAASAKPVCVVANSYGVYETKVFINNVFSPEGNYTYEQKGSAFPVDDLEKYSLVAVFHSAERPWTSEECSTIQKYLESGGHLLLGGFAARNLSKEVGAANIPWIGIKTVGAGKGAKAEVLKPAHPLLKGVFDTVTSPEWLASTYLGVVDSSALEILVGIPENRVMVGFQKVGKGWVAFLSLEAFRFKKDMPQEEKDAYYKIFRNIVEMANTSGEI
ncbi:MAG: hypothetical protein WDA18_09830 [Candidatus Ratteibacteria bacterium]|jgi:hypothetical protein